MTAFPKTASNPQRSFDCLAMFLKWYLIVLNHTLTHTLSPVYHGPPCLPISLHLLKHPGDISGQGSWFKAWKRKGTGETHVPEQWRAKWSSKMSDQRNGPYVSAMGEPWKNFQHSTNFILKIMWDHIENVWEGSRKSSSEILWKCPRERWQGADYMQHQQTWRRSEF